MDKTTTSGDHPEAVSNNIKKKRCEFCNKKSLMLFKSQLNVFQKSIPISENNSTFSVCDIAKPINLLLSWISSIASL